MVRYSGARAVYLLARRSITSKLLEDSHSLLNNSLRGGSRRGFISGIQNPYKIGGYVNSEIKLGSGGLRGVINGNWSAKRSIHATGPTCMSSRDYYDVLGVSKDSSASDIKNAYHALAKKLHPDVNKDDADVKAKFQEVQKAYEVLKDEEKRSVYDQVGHEEFENGGGPNPFDFNPGGRNPFDIFDFIRPNPVGGEDVTIPLELSFMEAVQGCSKTVTFKTSIKCETCGGSGVPPGTKPETCRPCRGSGMIYMQQGPFRLQSTCAHCGGTGKSVKSLCKSCKGQRVVKGPKTVKIDVMAGIDDSETLQVYRRGGSDPDGHRHGDLFVAVKVRKDPIFRREGPDIHVNASLSINQAILGGNIQVPTLTGDIVVKVHAGTQPGQQVVLRKKGIKQRNSSSFGDQYVHFNVSIPTNLTQRQRSLIKEFGKEDNGEEEKGVAAAAAEASG
ncbi:hypothetical protein C5167_001630 [Papaver somniferum]|uniref:J domain-containing protein n=1 Tax=Papaver somniferum TaxID=3469 RepID=A0A4Y7KZ86_PAPSO|nr:chaperone protein dnaJ GFA2, mitochondrial-like [Papaver somniferum]RZC77401.1 hypothetical protein C5167_001630 [Papaver somniferum]